MLPFVLWLTAAVAGAPVAPPGARAELVAESLTVQVGARECTVVIEPTVATDAATVALVWRVPQPAAAEAEERGLGDRLAAIPRTVRPVVWHRKLVWTTTPQAWRTWRAGEYGAAVAGETVSASGGSAAGTVSVLADASPAGVEAKLRALGLAPPATLAAWLGGPAAKERAAVVVSYDLGRAARGLRAVALPAVKLTYPAAGACVPFSEPQQPGDDTAAATDRPCRLAILAAGRMRPTLPDGTPAFPTMALRYAHDLDAAVWPAGAPPREAGHYLTYYEANVPRTARREDLALRADQGKDVAPTEPERRQRPVPVPVDLVAVLAVAGLALLWRRRRRRARAARAS